MTTLLELRSAHLASSSISLPNLPLPFMIQLGGPVKAVFRRACRMGLEGIRIEAPKFSISVAGWLKSKKRTMP